MRVITVGKAVIRRSTDGKYLILISSKWEERPDRSEKPDLPGGVVETGETPQEGCAREIMEEAGIAVEPQDLQLVHAHSFISDRDQAGINRLIYFTELNKDPVITLSWEHTSYQWMTAQEVLALDIRQPYLEVFRHLEAIGAVY